MSTLSDQLRSRLGLPADATEEQILAAVAEPTKPAEPTTDPEKTDPADPVTEPVKPADPAPTQPAPESVAAAKGGDAELRKEVQVLASRLEAVSAELAASKAKEASTVKASVLDAAQKAGKFTPADRKQWETDYDTAPAAVTRILASIAPGTAVPVAAAGTVGDPDLDVTASSFNDAEYDRLFGAAAGKGA